jgi:uncharacterized membrane-anchored protein YitT (DUF2179 family)
MTDIIISQIVATIFYLGTGFALGFLYSKNNNKKTARSIVDEMEKRLTIENKKEGATEK